MQINRYLVAELKRLGLWSEQMRNRIKLAEGSVQSLIELPTTPKPSSAPRGRFPCAPSSTWAPPGALIDQSQWLNLFSESA